VKSNFDDTKPIFQQLADMIADEIIDDELKEGDQIPSTTELSKFYQINRATAQKGLATLVADGLVYKKRGVGMFVAEGARKTLLAERQQEFYKQYVQPMIDEAKRIHLSEEEIIHFIKEVTND
jgi:GntR family transcriptional regulator